jgi:hypothetical protein
MMKLKFMCACAIFFLTLTSMFSQDFKRNTIKLTPSYSGYNGLSFKLNYERNLTNKFIAFGSFESDSRFYKSLGLGLKYKFLEYKKLEGLVGGEVAFSRFDNSSLGYKPYNKIEFKPSIELRYKFNESAFISLDLATKGIGTGNKIKPNLGIGVGFKF